MPFETPGSYACDSEILEFSSTFLKVALWQSWLSIANSIYLVSICDDLFFFLILNKIKKGCVIQVRVVCRKDTGVAHKEDSH